MIEARPAGRAPVAVTVHAASIDEALNIAIGKLATLLGRERSRHDHHKGGATIRTAGGNDFAPQTTPAADDQGHLGLEAEEADSTHGHESSSQHGPRWESFVGPPRAGRVGVGAVHPGHLG